MAKRFIDTRLYQKQWFRKLTANQKCLWHWALAQCDNAGVLEFDPDLASFQIGAEVSLEDLEQFGGKLELLENGKYWVTDFITFQYGALREDYNPHRPTIASLKKNGLFLRVSEGLGNTCSSIIDKDKDKNKAKDKDIGDFDKAYQEYPKKMGKQKGLVKIKKEVKTREDFILFVKAIRNYDKYTIDSKTETQFIKHFSTFVTEWRDWIEAPEASKGPEKIDKNKLRRAISSNCRKVADAKKEFGLSDMECDFLINKGGLTYFKTLKDDFALNNALNQS